MQTVTKRLIMKINCVIVTYNRVELLKENLDAVMSQTYPLHKIFVINNHSTDSTEEYLTRFSDNPQIIACNLEENIGGAGGFSYGLKKAVQEGCDYVWMMDDDTIPAPDALERLVEATAIDPDTGFMCSKVVWTDGELHRMNQCGIYVPEIKVCMPDNESVYAFKCFHCTFVSVMFKAEAVRKVGLPYKEFFIWHDDIEYTERISHAGYTAYYVDKSVVVHKTAVNYRPHVEETTKKDLWKFYYQARNTTFLTYKRKPNKLATYLSLMNKYRKYLRKINLIKDKETRKYLKKEIKRGIMDGMNFRPEIEYID